MEQCEKLLYGVNDAAKLLSLGRSSVYKLLAQGRLRAVKVGDRRLVTRESIQHLLAQAA